MSEQSMMFWYLLETRRVMIISLNSANNSLAYPVFPSSVADKSFEDKDSVDGGLSSSSSSSKAPPGGRRTVVTSVRRPSSANTAKTTGEKRTALDYSHADSQHIFLSEGKEAGAGAVDEEDFIKAFEDVPSVQVRQMSTWVLRVILLLLLLLLL